MTETPPAPEFERPSAFPWPPVLFVGTIAAAWVLHRVVPQSWPGLDDPAARLAGLGLGLAGIALFIWAVVTLRRAHTTVLPHAGSAVLVTDGPYRIRRNPIYLAEIFVLFGLAELTKVIWLVILSPVFALLVIWLAVLPEERHLEARFGDAYRDYKERTRRLI